MPFVHLHVHDTYSVLDGYGTPEAMTGRCAEMGQIALAQTNHGSIAGHIAHQRACKVAGLYPVYGCEFYVADNLAHRGVTDEDEDDIKLKAGNKAEAEQMRKDIVKKAGDRAHILVLAKTQEGYSNLRSLVSISYLKGFYKRPRIDYATLFAHRNGLFVSTACQFGDIPRLLLDNKYEQAVLLARKYKQDFGDNFALEIMPLNMPEQIKVNTGIQRIHQETGIQVVATNDVHYPKFEDAWAQDILLAVGTGKTLTTPGRFTFNTTELYLRSEEQMRAAFGPHNLDPIFVQTALNNTYEVAFSCKANPLETVTGLPLLPIPESFGNDRDAYLRSLCGVGWKRRGFAALPSEATKPYADRVKYELGILRDKGFANYFLIVWDAIRWAKEHEIAVGPARGSSAGSLVAYLLGITDIDPIRHGLSFERFIAPHRCFPQGTEVTMSGTKKVIEQVNIGDKVETRVGSKEVEFVHKNWFCGDLIEITTEDAEGHKIALTPTPNHRIILNRDGKEERIEAENVKVGDELYGDRCQKMPTMRNAVQGIPFREETILQSSLLGRSNAKTPKENPETDGDHNSLCGMPPAVSRQERNAKILLQGMRLQGREIQNEKVLRPLWSRIYRTSHTKILLAKMRDAGKLNQGVFPRGGGGSKRSWHLRAFLFGSRLRTSVERGEHQIPLRTSMDCFIERSEVSAGFFPSRNELLCGNEGVDRTGRGKTYPDQRDVQGSRPSDSNYSSRGISSVREVKSVPTSPPSGESGATIYRVQNGSGGLSYLWRNVSKSGCPTKENLWMRLCKRLETVGTREKRSRRKNQSYLSRVRKNLRTLHSKCVAGQVLLPEVFLPARPLTVTGIRHIPYEGWVYNLAVCDVHEYYANGILVKNCDTPDIDVDFEDTRREEVKNYLSQKYGSECVANVATYNVLGFRSAFRDAARVYGVPQQDVNQAIGYFAPDSESTEEGGDIAIQSQDFITRYPNVLKAAEALRGQIRAGGTHAAGIVLSNRPLAEVTAMEVHGESAVVALTKDEAEALGLVKIDILGLKTMTVLSWAIRRVNEKRALQNLEPITLEGLVGSLDDPAVYREFAAGNTEAIFQFNRQGGRRLCMEVQPTCFNDIAAINALDRPGPLDSGGTGIYVERKRGREDVIPIHPVFDEITKETYGVLLYQEQVMRICRELAGLDWPDVHAIRKTVAKSQGYEAVEEYWSKFKTGAILNNCSEGTARMIWEQILTFGRYGFNKSHAIAYAAIGYTSMWLKIYYPQEYLCAVMRYGSNEREAVLEARKAHIRVAEPDINRSEIDYSIQGEDIFTGFSSIKGIGPEAAMAIVAARGDTPFASFTDFRSRIKEGHARKVHKGVVRTLIEVGAFEGLHFNTQMLLTISERQQKDTLDLFNMQNGLPPEVNEIVAPNEDLLIKRVALMPFVPLNHPGLHFKDVMESLDSIYPARTTILELKEAGRNRVRNEIRTISGMVTDSELRAGEFGSFKKVVLITVEDETGEIVIRLDPKNLPYEADRFGTGLKRAFIAVVSPISEYRADVREIADLCDFRRGLLDRARLVCSMEHLVEAPGRGVAQHREGKDKTIKAAVKVKRPTLVGLAMRVWSGKTRKTQETMGFVDLADETTQQIVLLWPQSWASYNDIIKEGHIYRAKLSTMKDGTLSCDTTRGDYFHDLTPDPADSPEE